MEKQSSRLEEDALFKGLTRPAMFLGVPLTPLFVVGGLCVLFASYTKLYNFIILLPAILILRLITSMDEKAFDLLWTKRKLFIPKLKSRAYKKAFKAHHYSHNNFSKPQSTPPRNDKRDITMLNLQENMTLEQVIPYSSCLNDKVILTKKGQYVATWEVEGISFQTRDNEDLDRFKQSLNTLLRALGYPLSVYTYNCRGFSSVDLHENLEGFAEEINQKYLSSFSDTEFMENRLFFSLVLNESLDRLASTQQKISNIENGLLKFNDIVDKVDTGLRKFGASSLKNYEDDKGVIFSPQLSFFNYLLTNKWQKVRVLDSPIYKYLGNIDILFGKDIAEIRQGDNIKFARSIEIKDWVSKTNSGFLDALIGSKCEYVLTQSFSIESKKEAKKQIDKQINQLRSAEDDSVKQVVEMEQALDDLASGEVVFGQHHLTAVVFADSIEALKKSTNDMETVLEDIGFLTSFSHISFDEAYFSQLPSNFSFRPRLSLISSRNFAGLADFHNNPVGKSKNNCWGEAVTVLKTDNNAPFYFNFHQVKVGRNDFGEKHLGHTLMLGKSGTGKTVTATFLLSQLLKYKTPEKKFTGIYLDKDYGAEIAIKALGGHYNRLELGKPTNFNPFLMDATDGNIEFLNQLVSILATTNGEKLTTTEKEQINFAVKVVMSLEKENRKFGITRLLENIQDDVSNEDSLSKRLALWSQNGIYGWVLDNDSDTLDFNNYDLYGIDGTEVLPYDEIIKPLSFYLLYRIQKIADGRRLSVFIDEFWNWLRGKPFEQFAYDGLKTMRKKDTFLNLITQSPDEILKSPIARAIIEQIETFIFLPNSKADRSEYMKEFKCSEKEYNIIRSLEDDSRQFLVKKGNESEGDTRGNTVLCKLDLSGLGRGNLKVLSSSTDNVKILNEITNKVGDNPADWIPIFKEKCF